MEIPSPSPSFSFSKYGIIVVCSIGQYPRVGKLKTTYVKELTCFKCNDFDEIIYILTHGMEWLESHIADDLKIFDESVERILVNNVE